MEFIPAQCVAGRGLVGLTQDDLAAKSGVSRRTIIAFESGRTNPTNVNLAAMRAAIEAAGAVFIDRDEFGGPGVRLKE